MKEIICFCLIVMAISAQSQSIQVSEDSLIKKWELATVNIEATTSLFDEVNLQRQLAFSKLDSATIHKQLAILAENKVGGSGTAIYLKYDNIHYLITARHVLEDLNYSNAPGTPYEKIFFPKNVNVANDSDNKAVLVVPQPLDTNLHIGNFIFSSKDTDIAIIALDPYKYSTSLCDVPKILQSRGYEPIEIGSIDTIQDFKRGDIAYTIGFPDLSMIGKKPTLDSFEYFQSNSVTVPVVSVGKILGGKDGTAYLVSDAFVYHGHSGGPLIWNNKLIGIVHGPNLEKRQVLGTRLRYFWFLNGNQFIEAKYVIPLLRFFAKSIKENNLYLRSHHLID